MLNSHQISQLTDDQQLEYDLLLRNNDQDAIAQFEYFFGFTMGNVEKIQVVNKEVQLYQQAAETIKLKSVAQLLGFVPHKGQQPVFYTFDEQAELYNNLVLVLGRRVGKSTVTSVIAVRELLLPFSNTVLIAPTFNNAQIIFNNVLQYVQQLKLPIKYMNRGNFRFTLENGARFSANSEANIESVLGSSISATIGDECQSIATLDNIMNQMLVPTLLDYGTRKSGILYAHQIYLGTPRGKENILYDLYCKEQRFSNWKSFNAPSHTNPTLPQAYLEQMRLDLGDLLYRQEILAEFHGSDKNVFHAFNQAVNLFDPAEYHPTQYSTWITGIDIGFSDSTAQVWIYREPDGSYYVVHAYSENRRTTAQHLEAFAEQDSRMCGQVEARYIDPAAAQTAFDFVQTYNYEVTPGKNAVKESLAYINLLLTPTGANMKPKLYISKELHELIRQVSRVTYKDRLASNAKDVFDRDPNGTHWDLIAALRYALYSDMYNVSALNIFSSGAKK